MITDEDVYRRIDEVILHREHARYESLDRMEELREQIFHSIRGFDVLETYLKDDRVTEIMVVGHNKIFIEREGRILLTGESFRDEEDLLRLIEHIIAPTNRIVNESSPIVDSRLPDGSRVHVVLPPVSLEGPVVTIRKFPSDGMTMEKLIRYGEFPRELYAVLGCFVKARYNILISGATNSGKSSLINALAGFIDPLERIITIEDSAELQFYQVKNLVRLETRNANVEGENEISMDQLIRASLRMRPDRIIVGEIRGAEAICMIQALSTGHNGSFSSIHANSCRDCLRRLETMVLMGELDLSLQAVRGLIGSSVDILIHLGRLPDGRRKIMEITQLEGFGEDYEMNPLFVYDREEDRLKKVNLISGGERLITYGQREDYEEAMAVFA